MPEYQTHKQPVTWQCRNPECVVDQIDRLYAFRSDYPTCPKCGATGEPFVTKQVLIHLLVRDPRGRILGAAGRYNLACDKRREHTATIGNGEGATGDPRHVTCPGCLGFIEKNNPGQQGVPIRFNEQPAGRA